MSHEDHLALVNRILEIQKQIIRFPDGKVKLDLKRFLSNVMKLLSDRDKLSVECRRLGKITCDFKLKSAELEEAVSNLEQYLLMALLITSE